MELSEMAKKEAQSLERYLNPLLKAQLRNKPCICGSGKKVKKCCGKDRVITFAKHEEIKMNYYRKSQEVENEKV